MTAGERLGWPLSVIAAIETKFSAHTSTITPPRRFSILKLPLAGNSKRKPSDIWKCAGEIIGPALATRAIHSTAIRPNVFLRKQERARRLSTAKNILLVAWTLSEILS